MAEQYDIVKVLKNPGFSTSNRSGKYGIVLTKWSKDKNDQDYSYLAVQDEHGVSWPLKDDEVELVGHLDLSKPTISQP